MSLLINRMRSSFRLPTDEVLEMYGCNDPELGLSNSTVITLRLVHGPNSLEKEDKVFNFILVANFQ